MPHHQKSTHILSFQANCHKINTLSEDLWNVSNSIPFQWVNKLKLRILYNLTKGILLVSRGCRNLEKTTSPKSPELLGKILQA